MSDEPKYPPHYNAELIDQYETYMRHKKEAPAKEPSLESLDVEQPKVEPPKPEPAKGALPFEPASFNPGDLTQVPGVVGRQTRWIVESALYPQPVLALGSALVTVGVAMSRK